MTQQIATPDGAPPYNPRYGDAFVVFAVTVLSCALGAWLLQRLGLALWAGTVAALAIYALLLSLHLLLRRSLAGNGPPEAGTAPPAAAKDATPRPSEPAAVSGREQAATTAPFDFRPSREPPFSSAMRGSQPAAAPSTEPRPTEPPPHAQAAQPEMSVEVVQDLIKKLADELNSATPGDEQGGAADRGDDTEAMIGRSVAALQTAARGMHAGGSRPPPWWPAPEPDTGPQLPSGPALRAAVPPQVEPQLARIAEAVAAERMEVMLEPIHALVEGRPRHFEVSTRLLTADGARLDQQEVSRAVRGSGLMPRIDAARIVRAARVAGRLGQRGRKGAVLAAMSGESLADASFMDAATTGYGGGGMSLVLAFTQSEVRTFTPVHTTALAALAGMGFRFGLEAVTDLDMDFAALKQIGFSFVELDAPVFLEGLPCAGGQVPAADICRHLADFGLSLIVGRIEDDWLLARVLGFGVLFGKGTLFGGPRQVKDEVVSSGHAAA